jgi:hypothetical protein
MAGAQLRQGGVSRAYQFAVEGARTPTIEQERQDDRSEAVEDLHRTATWRVPPVLVAGAVLGERDGDVPLFSSFTWLGNLFGLVDWIEASGSAKHRVWLWRRHID